MTNIAPNSIDKPRLCSDISMNVAGRKIRELTVTSGMAGFSVSSASSTPRVSCSVFAPGCFSTISISPSPCRSQRRRLAEASLR